MAERRMFSKRIVESARFMRMPISTQALYFHLGLNADDDGIVEAFNVIRATGCTEDDLKVLVAKGFVQVLNEDLVSYISDWSENNKIRADRKIDSIYKDLLISMNPDAFILEKRPRADVLKKKLSDGQTMDGQWTDDGQAMDGIGKDRLGKDSIGKDSINRESKSRAFTPPTLEELTAYCSERQNKVDPQRFMDFYESKGWMVGKNKMKDWKAAIRTWEQRDKESPKQTPAPTRRKKSPLLQRQYTDEEYLEMERKKLGIGGKNEPT